MTLSPTRILVINVTRIGDTLLMTPALRAIATEWPNAEITVLGHPKRIEVLEGSPFLHQIGTITKQSARLRGWFNRRHYDLAIVYGHDPALLRFAKRCSQRLIGFQQSDPHVNQLLDACISEPEVHHEHAVLRALRLATLAGVSDTSITTAGKRLSYYPLPHEITWAQHQLHTRGIHNKKRVGFQVASFPTKAYRNWPVDSFIELAKNLQHAVPEVTFLLFGGPDDSAKIDALQSSLGTAAHNVSGGTLRQAGALLSQLSAYVGVDTGPTHLAGCFDIPLIGLYHCKYPQSLYGALDHPCNFSIDHPKHNGGCSEHSEMSEITVEHVKQQLLRAINLRPE